VADLAGRAAELRARGLSQSAAAAELGVSQQRVSQLLRGKSGHECAASTSPDSAASTSPDSAASTSPDSAASTSPDSAASTSPALEQARAELRARFERMWAALKAERDALAARVAELEAAPAAPGACPSCRGLLAAVCPRCEGLACD
jgi:transcriptional regulator with XRE-family HTH domain